MIAIIDYGSGNVAAIMNILKQLRVAHCLTSDLPELTDADRYILPGVGAFDPAMDSLRSSGIVDLLNEQVLERRKRVLGICVGMHLLADGSEEGSQPGLGWISGTVRRIDPARRNQPPRLPHMGWNSIETTSHTRLLDEVDLKQGFYFLHSYFYDVTDAAHLAATVDYGGPLPCAVERDNIFGAQFHPEKSHANGARLLANFAQLPSC